MICTTWTSYCYVIYLSYQSYNINVLRCEYLNQRTEQIVQTDFIHHACPSTCNNSVPTRWIFMKSDMWIVFENLLWKFKFHLSLTRIKSTVLEDVRIRTIKSDWILLRKKNISDKSCRENQNTHFMFNNLFMKIVPFMR